MRLASLLLAASLIQGVSSEDYYDDLPADLIDPFNNDTINEAHVNAHLEIHETLQHFHHCRDKEWPCNKHCRLEFRSETNQCRHSNSGDKCFGIPINYKYTRDSPIVGRFPSELEVLSRYPRCWSYLAPLICATIFRPCSRHLFVEKDQNGSVKRGTIELWQLFSSSTCETTRKMCSDIISAGLFPSFISCQNVSDSTGENRTLYSRSCKHMADELPVRAKSGACPWPLISANISTNMDEVPLFDSCFLPCRWLQIVENPECIMFTALKLGHPCFFLSPLVSSSLSNRYRYLRFVVCLLLAALFFAESIYLSRFCKNFNESLSLFYISHAAISIAWYCFVWSLSVFDIFFNLSDCSVDGLSRRDAASHSLLEWCSLQSIALYASFLAAFIWLVFHYINIICPSLFLITYLSGFFVKSPRPLLILCVYGLSVIISLSLRNLRENDGTSGVCFHGLLTWWKYFLSLLPLFGLSLILFSIGVLFISRRKVILKSAAFKQTLFNLNKAGQWEKSGSFAAIKFADIESLVNSKNSECCDEVLKQLDEDDRKEDLLRDGSLRHIFSNEFIKTYQSLNKRLQHNRSYEVSSRWTGTSFVCFVLFLVGSPILHFYYVGVPPKFEAGSIVDYVNCHIAHTIRNRSMEWTSRSDYALQSDEAPWCTLPFEKSKNRLEGVLIVFIILPVLPFLVFLLAFFASLNGYKGIGKTWSDYMGVSSRAADDEHGLCELSIPKNAVSVDLESAEAVGRASSNSEKNSDPDVVDDISTGHYTEIYKTNVNEVHGATASDCANQKEYEEEFSSIMNQLRGSLSFQQAMLVNDGAAWNISLYYLQRIEQLLRVSTKPVDACAQDLRSLGQEMTQMLPSVSEHAMQLSRWMSSIQQMCLKLEHIQRTANEVAYFGSQDISRQQHLLALNECLMRNLTANVNQHVSSHPANSEIPKNGIVSERACYQSALKEDSIKQQSSSKAREISNGDTIQEQGQQCDQEPGPSHGRENVHEVAQAVSGRPNTSAIAGNVPRQHTTGPHPVLRISAYAESYCATPHGILTKLTIPELRIRVEQIKNICAGDSLYPQELSYMLLVTGDVIFGGNRDSEGYNLYSMEQLPTIFGANPPTIDARVGVQEFLAHMRRRALCVVAAVGYHFSLHNRRGLEYTPPVLPPLGLYRSENELVLRRVLGDTDDVLPSLRDFLQEFQFGRGPVVPRPDLKYACAFRNYLCLVAAREGFNNDFEEYVSDPLPPVEPIIMSNSPEKSDASDVSDDEGDPAEPN